ncbi:MAG: hypothetical protein EA352_10275 [Gemmatimonadales bacterium]|nr:MAG: hypothetical protein EA352_10275 [Gemmatimonadales bacterium]
MSPGFWRAGQAALLAALLPVALGLAACASSDGTSTRTNSSLLTQEDLAAVDVSNLYDAVSRLRPRWLQVRSSRSINSDTVIGVWHGRTYLGDPEVLRGWSLGSIRQVRYLDGATASASLSGFRGAHLAGAIVIETENE